MADEQDAEERKGKLYESGLQGSLDLLAVTVCEHVVEPRVAKKERGRDRAAEGAHEARRAMLQPVAPRAAASATSKPTQATSQ